MEKERNKEGKKRNERKKSNVIKKHMVYLVYTSIISWWYPIISVYQKFKHDCYACMRGQ